MKLSRAPGAPSGASGSRYVRNWIEFLIGAGSVRQQYAMAMAAFLLIPVVVMVGMRVTIFINPEIAAGHPDYTRNWQLLSMVKRASFFATLLASAALWFLTGVFLLKAKRRSAWWLPLAVLGPFGFAILAMLGDKAPELGTRTSGGCTA